VSVRVPVPIHGVVLAAGSSRRLGHPKQLVRLGGETLLTRAARALLEGGADTLRIVLAPSAATDSAVEREAAETGARLVRSADADEGAAASIRAAVDDLAGETAPYGVLFAVVDQPALSAAHVAALLASFRDLEGRAPVASRYAGDLGVPAILPSALAPALAALRGDAGARAILRRHPETVAIDLPGGELDVDVSGDLDALERGRS
jgi:CTP:molybdopterin cytidylyltransferase MocA